MNKLLEAAKTKIGCGYVWGAQGEILTPAKLQWFKDTFGANHYVFTESDGVVVDAAKWTGSQVFDCSGLIVWFLRNEGLIAKDADYTAEGLYQLCTPIGPADELQPGDLVFRATASGSIPHIGIYAGGHKTVEAKGTRYGVVEGNLGDFNKFGRLKFDLKVDEPVTWTEVLNEISDSPARWKKAIDTAVNAAKASGNLGDLEIFAFLPTLIEKIANHYKK